jgi:hypothetical protein
MRFKVGCAMAQEASRAGAKQETGRLDAAFGFANGNK